MGKTTHAHCTKSLPSPCATIDTLSFLARFHFFCISAYFQQRPGHKSRAVLPTTENPTSFCTSRTPSPLSHVSHPTESLVDAALSIRSVIVVMIFWRLERSTVAAWYYLLFVRVLFFRGRKLGTGAARLSPHQHTPYVPLQHKARSQW